MKVKAGDTYPWNASGAICLVTEISHAKVKFDVIGLATSLSGQMSMEFFQEKFSKKKSKKK